MNLDRRRLEEAFLLYASLEVIHKYNLWQQLPTLPSDRNEILQQVTREFNKAFLDKWRGKYNIIHMQAMTLSNFIINYIK